uniref:Putative secreted protein n=1 Tax=Psorophora albipes TaxID=869069 RepID=T1D5K3_9DIPT
MKTFFTLVMLSLIASTVVVLGLPLPEEGETTTTSSGGGLPYTWTAEHRTIGKSRSHKEDCGRCRQTDRGKDHRRNEEHSWAAISLDCVTSIVTGGIFYN